MKNYPDYHQKRILLVDDDDVIIRLFEKLFEKMNCKVHATKSGSEVNQQVNTVHQNFDCLILDRSMPEVGGDQIIATLREYESKHHISPIPALAHTGFTSFKDISDAKNMGYNDIIPKPCEINGLFRILDTALS